MARTADHDAASPTTASSGTHRSAQQQRAPESKATVVLTPDGHRWLMSRAAALASEADQAEWGDEGHARGSAELAQLSSILGQAITTDELPPERRGVVELGDEVTVEFDAGDTDQFLLVDPVEAPLDQLRISVESPLAQALLGRRVGEQAEVQRPPAATAAAFLPPAGSRRQPRTAIPPDGRKERSCSFASGGSWRRPRVDAPTLPQVRSRGGSAERGVGMVEAGRR
jgi:transcription elongation GreA/GreB family factor